MAIMSGFLATVLVVSALASAAPKDYHEGIWSGDGLILTLEKKGAGYGGRLFRDGRDLAIRGAVEDGVFYGEASDVDARRSWLIERAGEQIRFTIDSKVHVLSRFGPATGGSTGPAPELKPQARPAPAARITPAAGADRLVFNRVSIDDTGGWVGGSAGTMLAPAGWKTEARVQWFLHPTMPGRIVFNSVSPDGRSRIRMYPNQTYFMGPMIVSMREYYGNLVQQPAGSARAVIRTVVLPALHPRVRCAEAGAESLEGFARAIAAMNQHPASTSDADAVRLRVQCEPGMVEDLFAVYSQQRAGPAVYWQAQYLISVTSDAAGIDRASAMVAPMLRSLRVSLPWFNRMLQISEGFQQLQAQNIQLAGRQSQIIQQTSDHISANRRATYENMSRANERSMAKFSEHIRGVETWRNHHGEEVSVPSGYNRGWQADNGTVVLTDNPNLNPNTDPQLKGSNWHPMQR